MGRFARICRIRDRALTVAALVAFGLAAIVPAHRVVPTPSGTPPLAGVWPAARLFRMPAGTPDGWVYAPLAVLADGLSVGTMTTPDGATVRLVLVTGGTFRVLRADRPAGAAAYDAFATDGTRLYWMEKDGTGEALWRADLAGGPAVRLTRDTGDVLFTGSVHDLQLDAGALTWVSAARTGTEVRRVPAGGGRVSAMTVPGGWTPLDPPWLVSTPGVPGTPVEIYDPATGRRLRVPVGPADSATCDRAWCVVEAGTADGTGAVRLMRPDGTDARPLGDGGIDLVSSDVALRDRFEVLAEQSPGADGAERLWLYDIAAGRPVLVAASATAAYARGDFVWWATGDPTAPTWTALDLRSLA